LAHPRPRVRTSKSHVRWLFVASQPAPTPLSHAPELVDTRILVLPARLVNAGGADKIRRLSDAAGFR
jgi:hypothetical protein